MSKEASRDWVKVRSNLRTDQWYLLGKDLKYTIYTAIRQGGITALRDGVEVRTRKTRRVDGVRRCDILLKLED